MPLIDISNRKERSVLINPDDVAFVSVSPASYDERVSIHSKTGLVTHLKPYHVDLDGVVQKLIAHGCISNVAFTLSGQEQAPFYINPKAVELIVASPADAAGLHDVEFFIKGSDIVQRCSLTSNALAQVIKEAKGNGLLVSDDFEIMQDKFRPLTLILNPSCVGSMHQDDADSAMIYVNEQFIPLRKKASSAIGIVQFMDQIAEAGHLVKMHSAGQGMLEYTAAKNITRIDICGDTELRIHFNLIDGKNTRIPSMKSTHFNTVGQRMQALDAIEDKMAGRKPVSTKQRPPSCH